jgi:hypothetical protein
MPWGGEVSDGEGRRVIQLLELYAPPCLGRFA